MRNTQRINKSQLRRKLKINQGIEIEFLHEQYEDKYSAQIADILTEDTFLITNPFANGKLIKISNGTKGTVFLQKQNGLYRIPVTVISKEVDVTPLLKLKISGQIKRTQERKSFRLEIYEETEYELVGAEVFQAENITGIDGEENDHKALIVDISAGGLKMKMQTMMELEEEEIIRINLDFADLSVTKVLGQVVRVTEKIENDQKKYIVGVKFVNLAKEHKDKLVKWIFDKQRELRQKGLI
ncbi:flagellar brake protein [Natroniella sp. ANB-PHB2]|uniref:flagellar brake protein n=1 Tax=Natroniella sp. ANB-PHB2 TaxID=3384444 RepID=UPI0038D45E0C